MVLTAQKRVATGVFALALIMSVPAIHPKSNNTAAKVATGCAITAGILGLVGAVSAGINYFSNKSDEQVLEDGVSALHFAHLYGTRFKPLYIQVFDSTSYGSPTLNDIEINFLLPIVMASIQEGFSILAHVDGVAHGVAMLRDALSSVTDRMQTLKHNGQRHTRIYQELKSIRSELKAEFSYMEGYSAQLTRHRAFFALYVYESTLCGIYAQELEVGRLYQHDPYLFERYIMQVIGMHSGYNDYALIAYHAQLSDHIDQLESHMQQLRYHYPSRTPLAHQLLSYLRYVRAVIETMSVFKQESRMKQEADDRAEWLLIKQRQAAAAEANAYAAQMMADAARASARAERERNCIEHARYSSTPAHTSQVSVTFNV
jgi:hypothetical protein